MTDKTRHIPVMLKEMLCYLAPRDGEVYVDGTFGNGGYSEAILKSALCKVIAIDRDPDVKARAGELQNIYGSRFSFIPGRFGNLKNLISEPVDGFVFDIGVSSMQLDEAGRGFSFSKEAPLDMRMSRSGLTAAEIVNTYEEKDIADILYNFGEERKSRQIARKIAEARRQKPIETTTELAKIVHSALPGFSGGTDSATRTFQALRIAVNGELDELRAALAAAAECLKPGGRIVVVDFHSLEDRIVKNFFAEHAGKKPGVSRYLPQAENHADRIFSFVSKAIVPGSGEIAANLRARSAKLRFAVKTAPENCPAGQPGGCHD